MCIGLRWDGRFQETAKTEAACRISTYDDIHVYTWVVNPNQVLTLC